MWLDSHSGSYLQGWCWWFSSCLGQHRVWWSCSWFGKEFIKGFRCNLGSCNTVTRGLWGLFLGIKLARELSLPFVIFEMDSHVMVNLVSKGSTHNVLVQLMLDDILRLLHLPDWQTSIVLTYHEANRCADFLANLGHTDGAD